MFSGSHRAAKNEPQSQLSVYLKLTGHLGLNFTLMNSFHSSN